MFISVSRTKIKKRKENQVTSHLIFEPHRRQSIDNLKLHEDGIFSKRIFGNFHRCECGEKSGEGFCEMCNTRVISPKNMPDFFIDLTINVPASFADYNHLLDLGIEREDAEGIMKYERFVYQNDDGSISIHSLNDALESDKFDQSRVLIGIDALKAIDVPYEWIVENTVDSLNIPHPAYRPLIANNMTIPFITGINMLYSNIIRKINDAIEMHDFTKGRPFYLMAEYRTIVTLYNQIIESLFDELQNVKYSILKSEIISHPISGAIRAVLTNRHDVHEDVLLIGDTLVETLWPYLYKKHDGNMAAINEELVEKNYLVLVNRPPTISHLSIIAMKPRIASIYPYGKTEDTDRCLLHNYNYAIRNENLIGVFEDDTGELGDIERFGQGLEDGIDNCGLRVIGMNPISMDGLAADVDGDVLLVIALYSKEALKQAREILPSKCYQNYANGSIRNHIIEDFIFIDEE